MVKMAGGGLSTKQPGSGLGGVSYNARPAYQSTQLPPLSSGGGAGNGGDSARPYSEVGKMPLSIIPTRPKGPVDLVSEQQKPFMQGTPLEPLGQVFGAVNQAGGLLKSIPGQVQNSAQWLLEGDTQRRRELEEKVAFGELNQEQAWSELARSRFHDQKMPEWLVNVMVQPTSDAGLIGAGVNDAVNFLSFPSNVGEWATMEALDVAGRDRVQELKDASDAVLGGNTELIKLRDAAKAGMEDWEVKGKLVTLGFATSNPRDPFTSLAGSLATDPTVWISGGLSLVGKGSAMVLRGVMREVTKELGEDMLARVSKDMLESGVAKALRHEDIALAFTSSPKYAEAYKAIKPGLTKMEVWMLEDAPMVMKIGQKVENVLEPWTLLSRSHAGTLSAARVAADAGQAVVDGYGAATVRGLRGKTAAAFGDEVAVALDDAMSVAGGQVVTQVGVREMSKNAIATQSFNGKLGVAGITEEASRRGAMMGGDFGRTASHYISSIRLRFVPTEAGEAGVRTMLAEARRVGAMQLEHLGNGRISPEQAARFVMDLGEDELSLLDFQNYGRVSETYLAARKLAADQHAQRLAKAEADALLPGRGKKARQAALQQLRATAPIDRVMFLGPRQATDADIREIAKLLEDASLGTFEERMREVRSIIRKFDDLYRAFSPDETVMTDGALANVLNKNMDRLLEATPESLTAEKIARLPPALREWAEKYAAMGYRVGLRPHDESAMRVIYDQHGRIIDVAPWIDITDARSAVTQVRRQDVISQYIFRNISGEAVQREAQAAFVRYAAERWALPENAARDVFRAIRQAAEDRRVTPRGLSPADIFLASRDVPMSAALKNAMTQRDLAHTFFRAHEGSLANVGVTQKFTGAIKTSEVGVFGSSVLGQIAEKIYPAAKFSLNIFFQVQEAIETPFFMLLRGQIPVADFKAVWTSAGRKRINEEVTETLWVMEQLKRNRDANSMVDNMENSAMVNAGDKSTSMALNNYPAVQRIIGVFPNVKAIKDWGVARAYEFNLDRDLYKAFKEASPANAAMWAKWMTYKSQYGDRAAAVAYTFDFIAKSNPDSVYARFGSQAFTPSRLGKRSVVSRELLKSLALGGDDTGRDVSWSTFRKMLADDPNKTTTLIETLRTIGADEDYIVRGVAMATMPHPDAFWEGIVKLGRTQAEVDAVRLSFQREAAIIGIDEDEYLTRRFAGMPVNVNLLQDVADTWNFQVIVDSLRAKGNDVLDIDHPLYAEMETETGTILRELAPPDEPTLVKDMTDEQAKNRQFMNARDRRAAEPEVAKPLQPRGLPREVRDSEGNLRHVFGPMTLDEWFESADSVFSEVQILEHAQWYPNMRQGMLALNDNDPKKAALELMAFGVSQLNTSPQAGMNNVRRALEMLARGQPLPEVKEELTSLLGLNGELMKRLMETGKLDSKGLGQKLYDFIDSLTGAKRRSVGVHGPRGDWGPAAFDIWAKRDIGYLDDSMTSHIKVVLGASKVVKRQTLLGQKMVKGKMTNQYDFHGWDIEMPDGSQSFVPVEDVGGGVPTDLEYDYGLEFYNNLRDMANAKGWHNKTDWTAADIQAVGWFRAKTVFGDATGSPTDAFMGQNANLHFEATPHPNAPDAELWPSIDDPVYDSLPDVHRKLMDDINGFNMSEVERVTGVRIVAHAPQNGAWNGTRAPGMVWELQGTPETIRAAAAMVARMNFQQAVIVSKIAGDQSVAKAGQRWAVDWTREGMDRRQAQALLDELFERGDESGLKGASIVTYDDGSFGVRSILDIAPTAADPKKGVKTSNVTRKRIDAFLPDENIMTVEGVTPEKIVIDTIYHETNNRKAAGWGAHYDEIVREAIGAEAADELVNVVVPASRRYYEQAHRRALGARLTDWRVRKGAADPDYEQRIRQFIDPSITDEDAAERVAGRVAGASDGGDGPYFQQVPRGTLGAVGFDGESRRASLALKKGAREDTLLHELGHMFLEQRLDHSGQKLILDLYNDAVAGGRVRGPQYRRYEAPPPRRYKTVTNGDGTKTRVYVGPDPKSPYADVTEYVDVADLEGADLAGNRLGTPKLTGGIRAERYRVGAPDEAAQAKYEADLLAYEEATAARAAAPPPAAPVAEVASDAPRVQAMADKVKALHDKHSASDTMQAKRLATELEKLEEEGFDFADERDLLSDWPERSDYDSGEDFRDAKEDVWNEVLDSLESKGDPEGLVDYDTQPVEDIAAAVAAPEAEFPPLPEGWQVRPGPDPDAAGQAWDELNGWLYQGRIKPGQTKSVYKANLDDGDLYAFRRRFAPFIKGDDITMPLERPANPGPATERRIVGPNGENDVQQALAPAGAMPEPVRPTPPPKGAMHTDVDLLAKDIEEFGVQEPLVITYYQGDRKAILSEGNHRLAAAKKAGVQRVPVRVVRIEGNAPKPKLGRKVVGKSPDEFNYVPGDMKPSDIGIKGHAEIGDRPFKLTRDPVPPATEVDRAVHEWFADQYVRWVASGESPMPSMDPIFKFYNSFIKKTSRGKGVDPEVAAALKRLTRARELKDPGFGHNADEQGLFDLMSVNSNVAQRNANDLIHFRTDRSWIERSANHPYFGMYPLSYMWGKVLPELTEFLVFRPFGLKMPFVALSQVQKLYQATMEQQAYDPELRAYMKEHEDAFRAIAMLVPGVPWDLPVNAPAWLRRIAEAVGTQQARVIEGTTNPDGSDAGIDLTKLDLGRIASDTTSYALNPIRGFESVGESFDAFKSLPGMALDAAQGDLRPDAEKLAAKQAEAPFLTTEQGGGGGQQAAPVAPQQPQQQQQQAAPAPAGQPTVISELESLMEDEYSEVAEELGGG